MSHTRRNELRPRPSTIKHSAQLQRLFPRWRQLQRAKARTELSTLTTVLLNRPFLARARPSQILPFLSRFVFTRAHHAVAFYMQVRNAPSRIADISSINLPSPSGVEQSFTRTPSEVCQVPSRLAAPLQQVISLFPRSSFLLPRSFTRSPLFSFPSLPLAPLVSFSTDLSLAGVGRSLPVVAQPLLFSDALPQLRGLVSPPVSFSRVLFFFDFFDVSFQTLVPGARVLFRALRA